MSELAGVIRWGDLPVPYVAAWTSEATMVIRHDTLMGEPAIFRTGRRGEGKPIFGKMDESRVRAVVRGKKCQVCARPLGKESFVLDTPFGRYGTAPIMHEPMACEPCFRLSLALCPGIARLRMRPRAFAAVVRAYECIASHVQPWHGPEGDAELNRVLGEWTGGAVVGHLRCALIDYDLLDLAAFEAVPA